MTVDTENEHHYRLAQRKVNNVFEQVRQSHPSMSVEEMWTHTAFRLALNYCQLLEHADINPVLEQITDINRQISDVLTEDETQQVSNWKSN